jgi:hypothetical protein
MIIPKKYIKMRQNLKYNSVSLGSMEVYIFKVQELEKAQIGYSVDISGNSLTGKNSGDWAENWLVIGYESLCEDPFLIDVKNGKYSVYMAIHGEGNWEPTLIADSFEKFIKNIECIKDISTGRENPVKLENNPISEVEKKKILKKIIKNDPKTDVSFWEFWLDL